MPQQRELKFHHSRTHCYSTQPVACIRGYEPSVPHHRSTYINIYGAPAFRLHFKLKQKPTYLMVCHLWTSRFQISKDTLETLLHMTVNLLGCMAVYVTACTTG